jgi:predicted nucleic acid-binding protein
MSWLIDTNITLRGLDRSHPHCRLVRRAIIELKRQGNQLFLTAQNLVEFWAVATRPVDANGLGMSIEWTAAQIARMKRFFTVLADGPEGYAEWERLVIQYRVSGKKVHDARLAAAMTVHGITHVLTFNVQDFVRYKDIQAVSPEEVVGALPK